MPKVLTNIQDVAQEFEEKVAQAVCSELKNLLENKHLYQSVSVSVVDIVKEISKYVQNETLKEKLSLTAGTAETIWPWYTEHFYNSGRTIPVPAFVNRPAPLLYMPDVKMYCATCKRDEPFNPVDSSPLLQGKNQWGVIHKGVQHQMYSLAYQCQSCKGVPEFFMVRRQGLKFTLCGRSPMETARVPNSIPKEISGFYSGAILAYQSGQILAGLFMLRTTCEQWALKFADEGSQGGDALEDYLTSLPKEFKTWAPSLSDVYAKLSAAIHSASDDQDLFEKCIVDMDDHFEARRVMKLSGPVEQAVQRRVRLQ